MKFSAALFATSAMAGLVVRDATIVNGVITTVITDLGAVKTAADAYTGDKTNLVAAANQLVSDLKDGKTKVDAGPDLDATDAINLTTSVSKLTDAGTALTNSLTARKPDVQKAGECKTVQDQIAAITSSSQALISSVVAKVPEAAQPIAQQLAGQLTTVLNKAAAAYQDCVDATGGSSSTGSSSATSSAASSGSATSSAQPTSSGSASQTATATTTSAPAATGTGSVKPTSTSVTVPTGAAAIYAPAGVLAAVAAALAL